jgi:hypothetical protein
LFNAASAASKAAAAGSLTPSGDDIDFPVGDLDIEAPKPGVLVSGMHARFDIEFVPVPRANDVDVFLRPGKTLAGSIVCDQFHHAVQNAPLTYGSALMNAFVFIGEKFAVDKKHTNFQIAANDHSSAAIFELFLARHI